MHNPDRDSRGGKGVTIIELVVVIVIVGVLVGVSSMYIKGVIDTWQFVSFRNDLASVGKMAIIRMDREIREIKDASSVYVAGSAQFRFHDTGGNDIQFQWVSDPDPSVKGSIMRNSDILVKGVESLTFSYYDKDNNLLASPAVNPSQTNIKRISVTFKILSGSQAKILSSQVFPRNL